MNFPWTLETGWNFQNTPDPERWVSVYGPDRELILYDCAKGDAAQEILEIHQRIVACVNACRGISTEDLKRGLLINGRNPAYAGDEDETIARQIRELKNWAYDSGHAYADDILAGVLQRLGFVKTVEAYEELDRKFE